ncbi:zinc finger protein 433-like [Cloeon dipterum]|uniref:zinc finger protein 433-like n=1 Tax=Cloeon dipterum TaxID=197152 RepID=UPI00322061BD
MYYFLFDFRSGLNERCKVKMDLSLTFHGNEKSGPSLLQESSVCDDSATPNSGSKHQMRSSLPAQLTELGNCLDPEGRYKCQFCLKRFSQDKLRTFMHHMRNYRCKQCKKQFNCWSKLMLHRNSTNCDSKKFVQEHDNDAGCSEIVEGKSFTDILSAQKYECKQCNNLFNSARGLNLHVALTHKAIVKRSREKKCTKCKIVFNSEHQVKKHKCKSKKQWEKCKFCSMMFFSSENHLKMARYRKCPSCYQLFVCRGVCQAHMKSCSPEKQNKATEEPSPAEFQEPSPAEFQEPALSTQWKCVHCETLCPSEEMLRNHSRPTNCPRCGFVQACSKMLANHLDCCRFERGAAPAAMLICPLCYSGFEDATRLGMHVLGCSPTQSPSLKFPCTFCTKVCHTESKLQSHEHRRHANQIAQAQLINDLTQENQKMKALTADFVKNRVVKKEPVEYITLDDSDDEDSFAARIKRESDSL